MADVLLLDTPRFSVRRVSRRASDGREYTRDIIEHPGAVVILPILENGSLVMIRNQRIAVGEELLELPAGTLEPNEPVEDCARRELEEETGYKATVFEPLIEFFTCPGNSNDHMHGFIARELTATRQRLDIGEQIRVEIMEPDNVLQMLREGAIRDAKTIATLATYFLRRDQ
ncbi:MAG: NUDIX hydrolase [bacterium]|nr:NUDIX hydrolase [bacterium]